MKYLELFCGTKSVCKSFEKIDGVECFTIDNDEQFEPDMCIDIMNLTSDDIIKEFGRPHFIWASPPCTKFSVATIEDGNVVARNEEAEEAKSLIIHTIKLIKELKPKFWFIENPRGMLRKMPFMQDFPRYTVTYCQYGDTRMKPTDIWTNHFAPKFKPPCKNGDPCHTPAPRGSSTGTQGLKSAIERGKIPEELCDHIAEICVKGLEFSRDFNSLLIRKLNGEEL